jgi:hypothetical protein
MSDLCDFDIEQVTNLLNIVAFSDPGGPTPKEYEAYEELLHLGFSPQWIDLETQRIRSKCA